MVRTKVMTVTPHSGGTPCDINTEVIYTPLKSTLNSVADNMDLSSFV